MPDQQKYTLGLANKHVLIIGGTSGLGFCVAEASLEHGARVTISSSQQSRVDDAVKRLLIAYPSAKSRVAGYTCQLRSDVVDAEVKALFEKTGKVDHVIHTAGDRLAVAPLDEVTVENIHKAGDVRFTSVLIVAKYAARYLTPGPTSSFTLTSGQVGERPHDNWNVVAGYAAGAYGMTRGLALDMKPIRVNCISPGGVDTELWDHMEPEMRKGLMASMAKSVPTGVVAKPEDVAEAYLYVMRDRNLTGQVIRSDSGASIV